jgi:hypothetical protein
MYRFKPTRRFVIGVVAVLALAGGAIAYWTNGGSGSGTAQVGTTTDNLVVTASVPSQLTPGNARTINITIDNTANDFASFVKRIRLDTSKAGADGIEVLGGGNANGGCLDSWFDFFGGAGSGVLNVNATVPRNGTLALQTADGGAHEAYAEMSESGTNQDECKGAQVKFHFVVDNS